MSRNFLIAIGVVLLIGIPVYLQIRKDDGMTKVQRDIAESLERAQKLRAQRDSLGGIVENRRFVKKEKTEESGEAGKTGQTNPGVVQASDTEGEAQVTPRANAVPVSGEGASVPADRFFTTAAMDGLTPQGKSTTFRTGGAVYIYAGVHAPSAEQLRVEWVNSSGQVLQSAMVEVQPNTGANGYRIYKYRSFSAPGKYVVKLYNSAGALIGSAEFEVVE